MTMKSEVRTSNFESNGTWRGMSSTQKLVSLQDGAAQVGVCVKTLRRWISDGRLTGYRLGPRAIRIDQAELFALARPLATG